MSTFNGIVSEFPRIRIDFFRTHPSQPPPLACFLSHIHSDHLQGLESLKAPFVYCSAATRRLLLRLEKYPHRMNFLKGVLESRKQHYRHLKLVLKAIPLECPTEIELGPLEKIRVTLFDANHCPGAVMFLIEGDSNKAILYTGDIRSEPWWVNSLVRNPILLPYTTGLKRLDRMYLDTTFATNEDVYRRFPSKAEGIRELLEKASKCPPETLFYLHAWTLGYEDVWVALSSFLKSRIHIDSYQARLYSSLSDADDKISVGEYTALNGFYVGNHHKPGCLTTQSNTRIHSCEPGTPCHSQLLKARHVVWITPIITRLKEGTVIPELGAGGGSGDLHQTSELNLSNIDSISQIEELCKQIFSEPNDVSRLLAKIEPLWSSREVKMSLNGLGLEHEEEITPDEFLKRLPALDGVTTIASDQGRSERPSSDDCRMGDTVHFPYSRHSSYAELCDLVAAFRPCDIYPCTVDEKNWTEEVSMKALFGQLCSGAKFIHDEEMRLPLHERLENDEPSLKRRKMNHLEDSQKSVSSDGASLEHEAVSGFGKPSRDQAPSTEPSDPVDIYAINAEDASDEDEPLPPQLAAIKSVYKSLMAEDALDDSASFLPDIDTADCEPANVYSNARLRLDGVDDEGPSRAATMPTFVTSNEPIDSSSRRHFREQAYRAAVAALETSDSGAWDDLGIRSLGNKGHCEAEEEL